MDNSVTSATYVRNIGHRSRCRLSDFLDPQDRWKDVLVSVQKPNGQPRFSQLDMRRYEGLIKQGQSPTVALLNDLGTTNMTVGDLVGILKRNKLLAAAGVLLPARVTRPTAQANVTATCEEEVPLAEAEQQAHSAERESSLPTRQLGERLLQPIPASFTLKPNVPEENTEPGHKEGFFSIRYTELMRITRNFDDRSTSDGGSRLGEGGFGTVYKGLLNDRLVAVKKLNPVDDMPLEALQVQFNQEIEALKVLKHENLVDMVGFSCDEQHLCLVYAFMANGSLLDCLACAEGTPPLSWQQRCLIVEGTARGLEYLHSNHHIHRDVKSANILLDENFVAKISDFGLTRASARRTSTTMMTERIVGTRAYMAPEALRGEITPKSDIFSFGVVLLEILSGLPPADENREPQFLMEMRYDIDDEDEELTLEDFLDKKMKDWELVQVETIYSLASSCLHERKNRRPVIKQILAEIHGVVKRISLDLEAQR